MKKTFKYTIIALLALTIFLLPISAAENWNATFCVDMSMGYDPETEIASVAVDIDPYLEDTMFEIYVALEQYTYDGWVEVQAWPVQLYVGPYFIFDGETTEKMPSGFSYRVHVWGIVDNGFTSDTLDQYSGESILQ